MRSAASHGHTACVPSGPRRQVEYRPVVPSPVRAEVQRLTAAHDVVTYGPHAHHFYQVVVFDRGSGVHVVEGQRFHAAAGQAWLLRPQITHDLAGLGSSEGWLLIIGAEALGAPLLPAASAPWPQDVPLTGFGSVDDSGRPAALALGPEGLQRWVDWLEAMQQELREGAMGHEHVVRALVNQLLVDAARRCATPALSVAHPLVTQALTLVDDLFRSPLSLADVAGALAVTPGHLTEVVRQRTGRPLGAWIVERRLAEARQLLADSDDPLALIATKAGFGTVTQFTRQFRQRHGRPPGAWRQALREPGNADGRP